MLVDGAIAGTWRPRTSGRKLTVTVRMFGTLPSRHETALRREAGQIAVLKNARSFDLQRE
ncbi:hypothetical protein L3i22_071770 [Actinoplanes sp. L3-i22]|nr:hypothetical protein L3i22_071770 [Actinoplanes sp. L3-i22]